MSLSQILETARKLGIPVIITNERGDAPQVVMPFEDFASMVGVSSSASAPKRAKISKAATSSAIERENEEIAQAIVDLAKQQIEREAEGVGPLNESIDIHVEKEDGFVEDNFYFEPLDEDSKDKAS